MAIRHDEHQEKIAISMPDYVARIASQAEVGFAHTLLYRGRVLASFGVARSVPGVGEAWLMHDITAIDHSAFLARLARSYMAQIPEAMELRRVQCLVACSNVKAVRFAEWLYFRREGVLREFGYADHAIMARFYNVRHSLQSESSQARSLDCSSATSAAKEFGETRGSA